MADKNFRVRHGLTVSGDAKASGNLSVQGGTLLSGAVQAKGQLSVGQVLTVGGNTNLNGILQVSGNLSLGGNLSVKGNTFVSGTATIGSTLTISTDTAPHIQIKGSGPNSIRFHDSGTTSVTNALDLVYRASPNTLGFERASDAATIWETDFDTLTTTFHEPLTVSGTITAATVDATTVQASGTISGNALHSATSLQVSGTASIGNVRVTGTLSVGGESNFASKLSADTISASGQVIVDQQVQADGSIIAGSNVRGTTICAQGSLFVNQNLRVTGTTQLKGGVSVTQTTTIAGSSFAGGWFRLGSAATGIAMDPNEIYFSGDGTFGTISGNLALNPAGSILAGTKTMTLQTLDATTVQASGTVSCETLHSAGTLQVSGTASIGTLNVAGTLSASRYSFEPYGVVPAYDNSAYQTVTYNSAESAIELSSGSDTSIGMAFPSWKVNVNPGNKWQITIQIRASTATANGVYIRLYEYDAELPAGKIAVSHDATNSLVQEDTRIKALSPTYENQAGSTDWQTLTFEYTPTSTAVWASVVVLNWTGLGTNALYVREPQINKILENIDIGSNIQATGQVSSGGNVYAGQQLRAGGSLSVAGSVIAKQNLHVSGTASIGGPLKVSGNICAVGQIIAGDTTSGRVSLTVNDGKGNANLTFNHHAGIPDVAGNAARIETNVDSTTSSFITLEVGSNLQAQVTVDLQTAATFFSNRTQINGELQALSNICAAGNIVGKATLQVSGQVSSGGNVYAGQQLRAGGSLSVAGNVIGKQNLHISGSGSFGTLKAAGVTCLQNQVFVSSALQIKSEIDFIGAANKYIDFMLVSSTQTTFNATFRSNNHQGQQFHTHLVLNRGAAVDLYYNNNLKAATRSGGFYVSGQLCTTGQVRLAGSVLATQTVRASGNLCGDGNGFINGSLQVCGSACIGGVLQLPSGVSVGGSGTIGGATFANGWFRLGSATAGIAMDPNEIYFSGAGNLGTLSGNLALNPAGQITAASKTMTLQTLDATTVVASGVLSGTQIRGTSLAVTTVDATNVQASGVLSGATIRGTSLAVTTVDAAGAIQSAGTVSGNALHSATTLQVSGTASIGGNCVVTGKVRGTQVCAQAQCLVNNQLRVTQGSIFNGTASFKNPNCFTQWSNTQQRRSVVARNDGGRMWTLVTGQQTAANVSWNSWRPFSINLSNGETIFGQKLNAGQISCSNIKATTTSFGGGADFAEYFEWADGNPNVSDRIGRSVVVTGASGKIGIATAGQTPFGVVTGRSVVAGDAHPTEWKNRYLRDEYFRHVLDENGNKISNPDYNSACTYIKRGKRAEWDVIGLVGKCNIRSGEVVNPNWTKLRVISPTVEEYLVR